jgi:hypothetical protein
MAAVSAALAALGLTLLASCGEGQAEPLPALHGMREVMFAIEGYDRVVEPNLRNPAMLSEIRGHLDAMASWARDPVFERWVETPIFQGDADRFLRLRNQLVSATEAARDAAAAGDLDRLRNEYIGMSMTCIACHKRYQPSY